MSPRFPPPSHEPGGQKYRPGSEERAMDTCGRYQAQLLDSLYDLLDAAEQQALAEHLAGCAACRDALERARAHQRLLARAAKVAFPAARFEAPPAAVPLPAPDRPATVPVTPRRVRWGRLAVAAAVLLPLAGRGAPGGWYGYDYVQTRRALDGHQAVVAQARQDLQDVDNKTAVAGRELMRREQALLEAARERQLRVVVSGPETVQPGAPNKYTIATRNLNEQPVAARLTVRVRDEAEKVLLEQKDVASAGDYQLGLPANLPLQPNARLSLEVVAHRDGVEGEVREELPLAPPLYVTHLATDRPMYQPGETVYYRSLTLERFSLKPPEEDLQLEYKLRKPSGEVVSLGRGISQLVEGDGKKPAAEAALEKAGDRLLQAGEAKDGTTVLGPDG